MKRISIFIIACILSLQIFSQTTAIPEVLRNKPMVREYRQPIRDLPLIEKAILSTNDYDLVVVPDETIIGRTYFDLQSNTSVSNRISMHQDGSIGAVWTRGMQATSFDDRGTGYNYNDGSSWDPEPTARIENIRTGWPSYDTWGANGEINVSHDASNLEICKRTTRGTGAWTETDYVGVAKPTWPRIVTSGSNHEYIHLVYNSYDPYNGQNSAMLYSRSNNGGSSWSPQNTIITGTGASYYTEIGADEYTMAARGNTVAILVASIWRDLFVLKSTNNGNTWSKIVIWEHPYPMFDFDVTITDTFFCVDNSASVAIAPDGKVHVVFGINRVLHDAVGTSYNYFPYVDGIGYWNEDMDAFSDDLNALAPPQYGYAASEMDEDYNYIGWTQDMDGDGEITFITTSTGFPMAYRSLGISTMPTISIDDAGNIYVAYASTTETYDNFEWNYKKIWMRAYDGIWGDFYHATSNVIHIFDESIYPVISQVSDDNVYLVYQADDEPGLALDGDHDYQENRIIVSSVPKSDLITMVTPDIDVDPMSMTINQSTSDQSQQSTSLSGIDYEIALRRNHPSVHNIKDTLINSNNDTLIIISVPGRPPADHRAPEAEYTESSNLLANVPAYDWSFGCSATSAAMMSGYYDNSDYPDMYLGPTNGGVAPMTNEIWGTVVINGELRSLCPLSATRQGLDGRTLFGHVDDYWILYGSTAPDPYIGNWAQHTYGDCTGDYMKTNQSVYNNTDGATTFYLNTDGSPTSTTIAEDGCYGLKLYFESRGYTVTDYFTQFIYGYNGNTLGFTFNQYKQEIDAGRPVLIHVDGHTMLGFGYDDNNNTVYLHDTWDYLDHTMTWGGTYDGDLVHYGVSVIELEALPVSYNYLTINNVGTGTLNVTSITESDPWIITSGYPATPFSIDPGAGQQVMVDIDWAQLTGTETGTIDISSNDPDEPTVSVTVTAIPSDLPDLIIQNQNVTPTTVTPGGNVNGSCDVFNQGNASAGSSNLKYYLSADGSYGGDDTELGTDPVGNLNSGEGSSQNQNLVIPSNTTPGIWYILFYADADNQVVESDENNNVSSFQISVQSSQPDLVVIDQNVNPSAIEPGGSINAACSVLNQGDGNAGSSILRYYLSANTSFGSGDIELGSDAVGSLSAGQSSSQNQTLIIPSNTNAGFWYILFYADADNQVGESNENNNVAYIQISVQITQPDLVVNNQNVNPPIVEPGGNLSASCVILNQGDGEAGTSYLKYYLSANSSYGSGDIELASDAVSALIPNQSSNQNEVLIIPANTTVGTWYIIFFADANYQVFESNENNNIAYVQINVQSNQADLIVENQNIIPSSAYPGTNITASCGVRNQGNSNAGNSTLKYYLSADNQFGSGDVSLGFDAIGVLSPSQSVTAEESLLIPSNTVPGSWFILFYSDADNAVIESNENNNIQSLPLTINNPPSVLLNLIPSSKDFGNVFTGNCSDEFEFVLSNSGTESSTGSIYLTGANMNDFEITEGGGSYTLPSYFSRSIKVKFCPLTNGNKTASLYVSTGNTLYDVSATLTGVGEETQTYYLTLSTDTLELGPSIGSTQNVSITSNVTWNILGYPTWLDLNMVTGSGNATLTVTANSNNSYGVPREVTLKVKGVNVSDRDLRVIQLPLTGIPEEEEFEINIYPNPAKDFVYIDVADIKDDLNAIEIINSVGMTVLKISPEKKSSDIITIDLTGLEAGCYIVHLNYKDIKLYRLLLITK